MASIRMPQTLPPRPVQSERKAVGAGVAPELALGDIAAKRVVKTDDARNEIRWAFTRRIAPFFDRAVELYLRDREIKAAELAERMTVDATVLSQMRAGQRQITEVQLEVLRAHRPSRLVLAAADRDRREVTFAMVRDRIVEVVLDEVRKGSLIGEAILNEAARREGVERGEVDAAIEQEAEEIEEELPAGSLT